MDYSLKLLIIGLVALVAIFFVVLAIMAKWYHKAEQGQAFVRTGSGGTKVSFNGIWKIPVFHRLEVMDISLKTIVIARQGKDGLICEDNMRADIKVTFFVRVNKTTEDVVQVAQTIGCERASDKDALEALFDAKFSEALKTVGKQFAFVDLYNKRDEFRQEILNIIGRDLNGYILDDAAIDYLEQTPLTFLDEKNILDAEGIKKITDLTAKQKVLANDIERNKEKTIKQQDVEAREAILELEKQLAETEEKQKREIETIRAREEAETRMVQEQERLKYEAARIKSDEEIEVAEENRRRQVIIATKNKERTEAIENERVIKDRDIEATEREKIVTLAQIAKDKAVEEERKNIQDVIRERVAIEKTVVEEQERIKDTEAFAGAERAKKVAITNAEEIAQSELVKRIKLAEAERDAAELDAKRKVIEADAEQITAAKKADAIKILADAQAAEHAAIGLSEAQVMEAKALAREKEGEAEASVVEDAMLAEAAGIRAKADAQSEYNLKVGKADAEVVAAKARADEEKGLAEARVLNEKFKADADGIKAKADAMKALDGVGKEHEEFKLKLDMQKEVELAKINIQERIAQAQAAVIAEALKTAKIDIVGGETMFFDQIIGAITRGKSVDRFVDNSDLLTEIKHNMLDAPEGQNFVHSVKQLIDRFGIGSEDIKNLSISMLLLKMFNQADDSETKGFLNQLMQIAKGLGVSDKKAGALGLNL
ncbi:flotillin family protein [bacterium]|nr:flotillin family protein [bacterium]